MDPFTHALSGALLTRAAARHSTESPSGQPELPLRLQILTGFAAAAFPDIDLVLRLIDTLTYLNWHQGPTHSIILLPLWAWLLAWLFSRLTRQANHQTEKEKTNMDSDSACQPLMVVEFLPLAELVAEKNLLFLTKENNIS